MTSAHRESAGRWRFPGFDDGDDAIRRRFLVRLAQLKPIVRAKLDRHVGPAFHQLKAAGLVIPAWAVLKQARRGSPLWLLRRRLEEWADEFRLDAEWVYDTALATLAAGATHADGSWAAPVSGRGSPFTTEEITLTVSIVGWDPARTGRAEAKRLLDDAYDRVRAEHFDKIERLAQARGGTPRRASRRRRCLVDQDAEIDAFILWQTAPETKTAGTTKASIRRRLRLNRSALDASLKRTGLALGIDTFVGKAGHPETAPPGATGDEEKSISALGRPA